MSFAPTGAEQVFIVPANVHSLHVVVIGGRGGGSVGGFGARLTGDLAVSPGQRIYVAVGQNGAAAGAGGFNGGAGGGMGGSGSFASGGGGASDLRRIPRGVSGSLASRLIVAAGGGGGGVLSGSGYGGEGGAAGQPGAPGFGSTINGGGAGTASAGGSGGPAGGGAPGGTGTLGLGGAGGAASSCAGGGGGGGYYGGGGGAGGAGGLDNCSTPRPGGGGGGSSYGGAATNASIAPDATGLPSITVNYSAVTPPPPAPDAVVFATSPKSLRVTKTGRFTYKLLATPLKNGTLSFKSTKKVKIGSKKRFMTVAKKSFTVPASAQVKVKFKLSKKNLKALKKKRTIRFKVTATLSGKPFTTKLTLKAPKKH